MKAIATIVTLVSVVVFASCASPPSDAHLLKQFDESREELEALLQELLTDPRMADLQMAHMLSGGLAAYEVSAAESSEYRQRLRKAGLRSVDDRHRIVDRYPIYFAVYEYSFYHDGVQKGFVWFPSSPGPYAKVVDQLDGRSRSEGEAIRSIGGNWYLFLRPN